MPPKKTLNKKTAPQADTTTADFPTKADPIQVWANKISEDFHTIVRGFRGKSETQRARDTDRASVTSVFAGINEAVAECLGSLEDINLKDLEKASRGGRATALVTLTQRALAALGEPEESKNPMLKTIILFPDPSVRSPFPTLPGDVAQLVAAERCGGLLHRIHVVRNFVVGSIRQQQPFNEENLRQLLAETVSVVSILEGNLTEVRTNPPTAFGADKELANTFRGNLTISYLAGLASALEVFNLLVGKMPVDLMKMYVELSTWDQKGACLDELK
jgi:hypothetical protein